LVVALALGAVALSGRLSVRASQILLSMAWLVVLIALRDQTWMIFCIGAVVSALVLGILAAFFRPEIVPKNFGALIPRRTLLLSPKNKHPIVEIGDGGTQLIWAGPKGQPLLQVSEESSLIIELIRGRVCVSTKIADANGNVVVELVRNKWRVAPPPMTWDRNYSKDALEVRDPSGAIVLQIKVLPDRIQLQGEWKQKNGSAIRFVKMHGGGGGRLVISPNGVFRPTD